MTYIQSEMFDRRIKSKSLILIKTNSKKEEKTFLAETETDIKPKYKELKDNWVMNEFYDANINSRKVIMTKIEPSAKVDANETLTVFEEVNGNEKSTETNQESSFQLEKIMTTTTTIKSKEDVESSVKEEYIENNFHDDLEKILKTCKEETKLKQHEVKTEQEADNVVKEEFVETNFHENIVEVLKICEEEIKDGKLESETKNITEKSEAKIKQSENLRAEENFTSQPTQPKPESVTRNIWDISAENESMRRMGFENVFSHKCSMQGHGGLCPEDHTCKLCGTKLVGNGSLKLHMYTHNPKASKPEETFKPKERLRKHTAKVHEKPVEEKKMKTRKYYETYRENGQTIEKNDKHKCDQCEYSCKTSGSLRTHMTTHTGVKDFKCTQCDFTCLYVSRLNIHMTKHTGERFLKCEQCSFSSNTSTHLKIHQRIHSGEKPYSCKVCDYSCNVSKSLKQHMRKHTGEKPYSCPQCSYATAYNTSTLNAHMKKHTGERFHKCGHCSFASSRASDLRIHQRVHSGEKPFSCKVCDYSCTTSQYLKRHMMKHTGEKPHSCPQCSFTFADKAGLRRHITNHHS